MVGGIGLGLPREPIELVPDFPAALASRLEDALLALPASAWSRGFRWSNGHEEWETMSYSTLLAPVAACVPVHALREEDAFHVKLWRALVWKTDGSLRRVGPPRLEGPVLDIRGSGCSYRIRDEDLAQLYRCIAVKVDALEPSAKGGRYASHTAMLRDLDALVPR